MVYIENADPDSDRNDFSSGRQITKAGSGLYWNFVGAMFGSEPQHYEPVDPALERMRANIRHYAGQQVPPPQPRRGFWERAGGWLAARTAPKPDAPVAPSYVVPAASFPEGMRAVEAGKAASPREKARAFLEANVTDAAVPSVEIERRAEDAGISVKMLRNVSKALGIKRQRFGGSTRGSGWWGWIKTAG